MIKLKGRLALITGGTRGIGAQIVDDFLCSGAQTIVIGKNKRSAILQKKNSLCEYIASDLSDPIALRDLIDQLSERKIDILVNNAGINKIDPIDELNPDDLDRILSVNLRTPILLTSVVSKGMKRRKYGRIINISSIFGLISKSERTAYTASKFGIRGLTVTSSIELAPFNILVNTVSPGFIETDMTKSILSSEERNNLAQQVPCGRLGTPKDISKIVTFLCSETNQYLTGQNIVVDGGFINV